MQPFRLNLRGVRQVRFAENENDQDLTDPDSSSTFQTFPSISSSSSSSSQEQRPQHFAAAFHVSTAAEAECIPLSSSSSSSLSSRVASSSHQLRSGALTSQSPSRTEQKPPQELLQSSPLDLSQRSSSSDLLRSSFARLEMPKASSSEPNSPSSTSTSSLSPESYMRGSPPFSEVMKELPLESLRSSSDISDMMPFPISSSSLTSMTTSPVGPSEAPSAVVALRRAFEEQAARVSSMQRELVAEKSRSLQLQRDLEAAQDKLDRQRRDLQAQAAEVGQLQRGLHIAAEDKTSLEDRFREMQKRAVGLQSSLWQAKDERKKDKVNMLRKYERDNLLLRNHSELGMLFIADDEKLDGEAPDILLPCECWCRLCGAGKPEKLSKQSSSTEDH